MELYLPAGKAHVHHCCLEIYFKRVTLERVKSYVRVVHLQDSGYQRGSVSGCNLVCALLRTSYRNSSQSGETYVARGENTGI